MLSFLKYAALLISALLVGLAGFVFWPAPHTPIPAPSECLSLKDDAGRLVPLAMDRDQLFGVALTYPGIIREGGYDFDPDTPPPVFRKLSSAAGVGRDVKYPSEDDVLETAEKLEPGLAGQLRKRFPSVPVLMDYEVELGIVLLEDISAAQIRDPGFSPKLGYFLANDLQSMTFGILGFGPLSAAPFLDQKGSFPGFLPVSETMWVPNAELPDSTLCIDLQTRVNNEVRQKQNTQNRIYTNKQILEFIVENYGKAVITKGTAVITGSPAGVANSTPRWKKRIGTLLGMDRFDKIAAVAASDKDEGRFLKPGDLVVVNAHPFGGIEIRIIE